ncbi:GNAT superfamily N-acetyltransferase [Microbacterium sp. 1154]|uniref:hypothetical protein n=1 Tax=Microbacterium sp. 1154 TaxID=2817733 RepID=UPI00285520E7|nr:hypothetical protein [Microbacterium sp. 1154]MDR6691318.1 GNAT superfamily N-acetyltransferase [Microbacterium sp. 1154]
MFDTEDDWNAMFADLAAQKAEADKATAALMARRLTVEREHRARGHAIDERERLRQQALRLARRAGVRGLARDAFSDHTTNQLRNIINEARGVLDSKIRN